MRELDFANGSFDLIRCEDAIYNVGVEAGLCDWRRLLRRIAHVALAEARATRRMRSIVEPGVPDSP
jgi:hypothetical protein